MHTLGVGLVYWSALEPIIGDLGALLGVLELEPQTLWEQAYDRAGWRYRLNEALFERFAGLPHNKLLHGVGQPLGGATQDPIDALPLLRMAVERVQPAWVSEHLSFNRIRRGQCVEHAGFLLPPAQTPAMVRVAADNIDCYRRALGRPVAFETGVNYLAPNAMELNDGEFFCAVAEESDSGILLDLHNLWCNERNGRQRVADVLAALPLHRVWEIHLAGGMEESGYWIDAHSGAVPGEVLEIAAEVIPRLPNLGALIFEVLPEHLARFRLDQVEQQVRALQELWELRGPVVERVAPRQRLMAPVTDDDQRQVAQCEIELVDRLRTPDPAEPGVELLRNLIGEFRRANLARALRYTVSALLAGLGVRGTGNVLDAYLEASAPEPFGAVEADRFASFLEERLPTVPFLAEVLAYEHALVRAAIYGTSSEVRWSADPARILESLEQGRLPEQLPTVSSRMLVCAD